LSVRTFLEKGEKPEKRRSQEGELRFCFYKVRVRLTLIKFKSIDDMLSLRNFYVYIITLWSSQGNLSNKKSKKTEEKGQVTKTCHVG